MVLGQMSMFCTVIASMIFGNEESKNWSLDVIDRSWCNSDEINQYPTLEWTVKLKLWVDCGEAVEAVEQDRRIYWRDYNRKGKTERIWGYGNYGDINEPCMRIVLHLFMVCAEEMMTGMWSSSRPKCHHYNLIFLSSPRRMELYV